MTISTHLLREEIWCWNQNCKNDLHILAVQNGRYAAGQLTLPAKHLSSFDVLPLFSAALNSSRKFILCISTLCYLHCKMLRRKECWSDGAAQTDQDNPASDASQSFSNFSHCLVRAHSLNDLDCHSSSAPLFHRSRQHGTSSSSDILARAALSPRYPLLPCGSPEVRCPTPPGLPSFGTREAETLRLMPLTHFERFTRFLQQKLAQRGAIEQQDQALRPPQQANTWANRIPSDEPAEMLRRALGTTMPVAIPVRPVRITRSRLPKGVIRSACPGVLAQADDRTYIRGRFGVRASAHGVGQRHIDNHPLAHLDGSSEIDTAIREIDKACREISNHQHDDLSVDDINLPRRHENTSPRAAFTTAMAIAESLTAIQAIEREQRALKALRDSRRENVRLRATLKALQESLPAVTPTSKHRATDSGASNDKTNPTLRRTDGADYSRLVTITDVDPPLRGDSEQTIEDDNPLNRASHPDMIEPALYSSYSSYSYTPEASDASPPQPSSRARRTLPTMESMIEHQNEEERRQATDETLNRNNVSKKTKCEHC